jgi:hypothetical protein
MSVYDNYDPLIHITEDQTGSYLSKDHKARWLVPLLVKNGDNPYFLISGQN